MANTIKVSIHHDLSEFPTEKHYDAGIKISELKKKFELITGANHSTMKISMSVDEKETKELDNDEETFGHFAGDFIGKDSILKLIVKDEQPTDLLSGDVPKFTISDEKYQTRQNTARNFIKEIREKHQSNE